MILNPNCSEVVWKITGIKQTGRTEWETYSDTDKYEDAFDVMCNILSEHRNKLGRTKLKIVESSTSIEPIQIIFKNAKKTILRDGEWSKEAEDRAIKEVDAYWDRQ